MKKKAIGVLIGSILLSTWIPVHAADGEIYDLNTKNKIYNLDQLVNLKNQLDVGLHQTKYGYELNNKIYKFRDVNKIYLKEHNKGNKNLKSILDKIEIQCNSQFDVNEFEIENLEFVEELISNNLYIEVSNTSNIKSITKNGKEIKINDRYTIEDNKIIISFKKGTKVNDIGNLVINTEKGSFKVNLEDVNNSEEFDVKDIY